MKLWLNDECAVVREEIVCILDMDSATVERTTRDFLTAAQKENRLITATEEIPVSFIVTAEKNKHRIFLTRNAPRVLRRRAGLTGI